MNAEFEILKVQFYQRKNPQKCTLKRGVLLGVICKQLQQ